MRSPSADAHQDPMIRDKKYLPMSDPFVATIWFLAYLLFLVPLVVVTLLPFTIIVRLVLFITYKVAGGNQSKSNRKSQEFLSGSEVVVANPINPMNKRKYDLVLYGATGFTGRMAVEYISKRYGVDSNTVIRWAISGRRKEALQDIQLQINKSYPGVSFDIIIADASDSAALDIMTKQTKVVITAAGPFSKYGSELVKICAVNGTHYCDITGETDWGREMIDKFDNIAKESGARIVHFCGHDCIPWDISVLECSKYLKQKGESLTEVHCYDEIFAGASGGTLATAFSILGSRTVYKSTLGFDPLLKTSNGNKSENKLIVKNTSFLTFANEYQRWTGPFVMAMVMANCIRRSNSLNNYSTKLVYKEAEVYPSYMAGFVTIVGYIITGLVALNPILSWLFLKLGLLPSPGEGPSEDRMNQGFLKVTTIGTGSNGGKVRVMFYFPTDPGYRDTARMLVESGLALALEGDKIKVGGGIYTPAACQGDVLTQRLLATGSTMTIE
eukprot:gene8390-11347_t